MSDTSHELGEIVEYRSTAHADTVRALAEHLCSDRPWTVNAVSVNALYPAIQANQGFEQFITDLRTALGALNHSLVARGSLNRSLRNTLGLQPEQTLILLVRPELPNKADEGSYIDAMQFYALGKRQMELLELNSLDDTARAVVREEASTELALMRADVARYEALEEELPHFREMARAVGQVMDPSDDVGGQLMATIQGVLEQIDDTRQPGKHARGGKWTARGERVDRISLLVGHLYAACSYAGVSFERLSLQIAGTDDEAASVATEFDAEG